MAGLWAIPAGISGGESYRNAIFWGQTAGRVVDSFAHKQPFWWYIPIIPLAIIPWIFLPRPIGGLFSIHRYWNQFGIRFLSIWILVVLIALSVISGKQIKYLVPLLPAVALLFAFVLNHQNEKSPSLFAGLKTPLAIFLGLGGLLSLLPFLPLAKYQALLALLDWRWGLGLLLSLATLLLTKKVVGFTATQYVGLASAISFFFVQMAILNPLAPAYDLHRVGAALKQLQSTGHKIAYLGTYHDQFHFLGRLEQPLVPITSPEAQSWIQDNPNQYIIVYYDEWDHKLAPEQPYYFQPYRSSILAIWNTSQLQRGSNYNWPLKDAKKESSSPD